MEKDMEKDQLFISTYLGAKSSKEDRTIEFIASKEIVDRSGNLIKIGGIDTSSYKANPVVLWTHRSDEPPIGKAVGIRRKGDELRIKVQFATPEEYGFADTIYKLADNGYINAGSIGLFLDSKGVEYPENMKVGGKEVRRLINKSELFDFSITPIPRNRKTLKASVLLQALDSGVIDDVELKEYELMSEGVVEGFEEEVKDDKEEENEVITLKAKVAELELQLKEQEMEEESKDSIYDELYNEFVVPKKEKIKVRDKFDILDDYFE